MARDDFREIQVFRDPDGVIAVVTERERDGTHYMSFAIQKEFLRQDTVVRTSFLNRRHIPAVKRLLEQLESFLDQEADRAAAQRRGK